MITFTSITCFPLKIKSVDWFLAVKVKEVIYAHIGKMSGKIVLRFIAKLHGVHSESRVFFFTLGSKYQALRHLRESNPSEKKQPKKTSKLPKMSPTTSSASQGWERGSCNASKDNCSKSGVWGESASIQSTGRCTVALCNNSRTL